MQMHTVYLDLAAVRQVLVPHFAGGILVQMFGLVSWLELSKW